MATYDMSPIIYAVATENGKGRHDSKLVYATVKRCSQPGHTYFEIKSRTGDILCVDNDAIDSLISALIQAKTPLMP